MKQNRNTNKQTDKQANKRGKVICCGTKYLEKKKIKSTHTQQEKQFEVEKKVM